MPDEISRIVDMRGIYKVEKYNLNRRGSQCSPIEVTGGMFFCHDGIAESMAIVTNRM